MRTLIYEVARQPPERAMGIARELSAEIGRDPANATLAVGRLVDTFRPFWDYMDVPSKPS